MFSGSVRDRAWLQQLSYDFAKFEMVDFWIQGILVLRKRGSDRLRTRLSCEWFHELMQGCASGFFFFFF